MNYGYDSETANWQESKKMELAERLSQELGLKFGWTAGGTKPYIEVDGLYSGVRIRKTTYLTEQETIELVKKADKIYNEVMKKSDLKFTDEGK